MDKRKNGLLIFVLLLIWSSCHFPVSHRCNYQDGSYLRGHAMLSYHKDGIRYNNVPIHFRIQKDHTIWFSIKTPWIHTEVVRGKITPHKIILMNHRQRMACTYNYAMICDQWGVKCSYQLLQALLLGTMPFVDNNGSKKSRNLQHKYIITINEQHNNCQIEYIYNEIKKWLLQVTLNNKITKDKFVITYKNHKRQQKIIRMYDVACIFLPTNVRNDYTIRISLSKMNLQESRTVLTFPFLIPTYYKQLFNKL